MASIVGTIDAAFMGVNYRVNAIAIVAGGDGDSDAAQAFAGETVAGALIPRWHGERACRPIDEGGPRSAIENIY